MGLVQTLSNVAGRKWRGSISELLRSNAINSTYFTIQQSIYVWNGAKLGAESNIQIWLDISPPKKKKCSLHLKTKPVNDLKVSAFALRSSQFSASLKKSTHIWNGTQLRTRLNQMHHTNFQSSTFQRSTCTRNDTKFGTHLNQILEAGLWFFQKKKNFHFLKLHFSHIFKSVYTLNRIRFGK